MAHVIAIYEVDRAFGGPEEGSWWYDCGQLVRILAVVHDKHRARATRDRLNRLLERLQRHRRPVSSIAYTGGRYEVMIHRDIAPPHFPEERPQYC